MNMPSIVRLSRYFRRSSPRVTVICLDGWSFRIPT
jgi:hypothetical protein